MKNEEYIKYTYKHRKIVMMLAKKYFKDNGQLLERIEYHDLDKLFTYLLYDKKIVSKIHRDNTTHHNNEIKKDNLDYIEMVLDWESARYTKPDKPLNAYDTLYKYYPSMEENILPILKLMNINESNLPMDNDILEYAKSLEKVTKKDIVEEMIKYIDILCNK